MPIILLFNAILYLQGREHRRLRALFRLIVRKALPHRLLDQLEQEAVQECFVYAAPITGSDLLQTPAGVGQATAEFRRRGRLSTIVGAVRDLGDPELLALVLAAVGAANAVRRSHAAMWRRVVPPREHGGALRQPYEIEAVSALTDAREFRDRVDFETATDAAIDALLWAHSPTSCLQFFVVIALTSPEILLRDPASTAKLISHVSMHRGVFRGSVELLSLVWPWLESQAERLVENPTAVQHSDQLQLLAEILRGSPHAPLGSLSADDLDLARDWLYQNRRQGLLRARSLGGLLAAWDLRE